MAMTALTQEQTSLDASSHNMWLPFVSKKKWMHNLKSVRQQHSMSFSMKLCVM